MALMLINDKANIIMASQAEVQADLESLQAQVDRNRQEVLAKIADLEAQIAQGGQSSPGVDAALAALKASVQAADDDVA